MQDVLAPADKLSDFLVSLELKLADLALGEVQVELEGGVEEDVGEVLLVGEEQQVLGGLQGVEQVVTGLAPAEVAVAKDVGEE